MEENATSLPGQTLPNENIEKYKLKLRILKGITIYVYSHGNILLKIKDKINKNVYSIIIILDNIKTI